MRPACDSDKAALSKDIQAGQTAWLPVGGRTRLKIRRSLPALFAGDSAQTAKCPPTYFFLPKWQEATLPAVLWRLSQCRAGVSRPDCKLHFNYSREEEEGNKEQTFNSELCFFLKRGCDEAPATAFYL